MQLLRERIRTDGRVKEGGVLKVDNFLNHALDPKLLRALAVELAERFRACGVTRVLTIEPNAIALATFVAEELDCTAVFAKKSRNANLKAGVLRAKVHSYTTGQDSDVLLPARHLGAKDRVLIVDDFLINGSAMNALLELCREAKAEIMGAGVAIEYANAKGGAWIRSQGVRVEALTTVDRLDVKEGVTFLSRE